MVNEADQILAKVRAAYAECRSYRDDGVVTTTFFGPQKRTERLPFSTRFVRPDGFLFEFRSRRWEDEWDQYAVWMEAGRPKTWWTVPSEGDDAKTLGHALAAATGVSAGSAWRVPSLLMPELKRRDGAPTPPPAVADFVASPEALLQNCVVVQRQYRFGAPPDQIWIDRSSFMIRKVVEPRRVLGPMPPEAIEHLKATHPELAAEMVQRSIEWAARPPVEIGSVTTYEALFDAEIKPEELRYTPPSE
ncbi:hypothetical protein BH11PLA1_BH11PLA1_10330 [soil metagenome]